MIVSDFQAFHQLSTCRVVTGRLGKDSNLNFYKLAMEGEPFDLILRSAERCVHWRGGDVYGGCGIVAFMGAWSSCLGPGARF